MIKKEIPKVKTSGLLGELKNYVADPLGYLQHQHKVMGDTFKFRVAHRYLTITSNPDYIQHILQGNHRNYIKSLAYRKLKSLLGNGLFTNEGDNWLKQRRLAQPYFHKDMIANYYAIMNEYADEFVDSVKGKEIDTLHEMTTLTLRIISKALLNVDVNKEGRMIEEHLPPALSFMIKRVISAVNTPLWFPNKSNKAYKNHVRALNSIIDKIIEQKKNEDSGFDMLYQMMQAMKDTAEGQMDEKQLRDEMITFFLAGHETSAISLTWAIYLIESHSEVKEKLKVELNSKTMSSARSIYDFPYLNAVIKEVMRFVSPIWVMSREAVGDDKLGDYQIKKGDSIVFSPFVVHHDEVHWDQPEQFNPDRFLRKEDKHSFQYFPFGGGPRLCIGQSFAMLEIAVVLNKLYTKLEFDLTNKEFPGFDFSLTLRPQNIITLKVK